MVVAENFTLSNAQYDLLNRGLTFVPTINANKKQKLQLLLDLQIYHRRIKLASYFEYSKTQTPPCFMPPSFWTPPPHKLPPEVHFLIKKDIKDFNGHLTSFQEEPNLSLREECALKELMQNRHIVIKPADKGSVIVILDRDQYITEVNRQLRDETYYRKLQEPIYLQTVPLVQKILDDLYRGKFITGKQRQYLKGDLEPRVRRFYILPKIHKDPKTWTVPFKLPPGRPIVSDCGSETYQTAEYIDSFLNPLSVKHPSYVRDTYHFISIIKNLKIPQNSFFFTIDIDSLYTNIDTDAGLSAVKNMFIKYPNNLRPDKQLLELLEINLLRNDFEFHDEYYLQIKGVAMGKKFAPAYANIFMADWEEKALGKCNKKPLQYLRYLDDIFGIWTYSQDEFLQFITTLDSHDPSIRLKYKFDHCSIDFLDTTVYKGKLFQEEQTLDTKVYFKETDTHALLFRTSFHPRHTYRGLIKSQLIRFKRICTQEADFRVAVEILFGELRKRGYSRSFLRHSLKTFQSHTPRDQRNLIPLITTFSSTSALLHNKFKSNYRTVIENQGLLKNYRIISAYRRNKNLRDYLVRAKLQVVQPQNKTTVLARNFIRLEYVFNRVHKTIFKIPQNFTPQTSNCVYIVFCSNCGKQYVGETKNSVATRMMQHRYNIKNNKEVTTPLVKHFLSHGWHCFRVSGLQCNSGWTDAERKKCERRWIYLLDTKEPFGLNKKYG